VGRSAGQTESSVGIPAGRVQLAADLAIPEGAAGIVAFAHGSGSGRWSPRNRFVASELQRAGLATLLMDLLTEAEERVDEGTRGSLRFDIPFLATRLEAASDWLASDPQTRRLKIGYFGASTGAAAALMAVAEWTGKVWAVVSRGGRPDLADWALPNVKAPTLLIVGGLDEVAIELNRDGMARMRCEKRMEIVPGATHLFEEQGTLDKVARLAAGWFQHHFTQAGNGTD
jgi:putative phosphoribosyl transferase